MVCLQGCPERVLAPHCRPLHSSGLGGNKTAKSSTAAPGLLLKIALQLRYHARRALRGSEQVVSDNVCLHGVYARTGAGAGPETINHSSF